MGMTYYDLALAPRVRYHQPEAHPHPYHLLTVDTLLAMHADLCERAAHYPVGFAAQHLTIGETLPEIETVLHLRGVHVTRTEVEGGGFTVEVVYEPNWSQR